MFHVASFEVNKAQALLLMSCMERNEKLARGEIDDKETEKQLWVQIVSNLNAIGEEKPLEIWKQIWQQLVANTIEKKINSTDIRIMNILGHKILGQVTLCKRGAENLKAAASNQPEEDIYLVEENQMKMQNRLLTHIVSNMNAHTRVVENVFITMNGNINKISKILKKKKSS